MTHDRDYKAFKSWLKSGGAEVLAPMGREVLRFKRGRFIGIVTVCKKGRHLPNELAQKYLDAFDRAAPVPKIASPAAPKPSAKCSPPPGRFSARSARLRDRTRFVRNRVKRPPYPKGRVPTADSRRPTNAKCYLRLCFTTRKADCESKEIEVAQRTHSPHRRIRSRHRRNAKALFAPRANSRSRPQGRLRAA